jgi:hypothetical protein
VDKAKVGRPRITEETLLETEVLVRKHGHYGAAEIIGITYHGVRVRMRKLLKLRGLPVHKRGKRIPMGEI